MRERKSIFSNVDPYLFFPYLLLILIGGLNLYSTTSTETLDFTSYEKQFVWIGLSLVLALFTMAVDVKFFESFAYIIYGVFVLMLLSVLVFGSEHKGAKSWFDIGGGFALQPTEFVKFATALAIAKYLSTHEVRVEYFKTKINVFLILSIPMLLILLQPDAGSTLVFLAFYLALYREGFPGEVLGIGFIAVFLFLLTIYAQTKQWVLSEAILIRGQHLLIAALVPLVFWLVQKANQRKKNRYLKAFIYAISVAFFIYSVDFTFNNVLEDRHRNRINELLGITFNPKGTGYNVHQSKIAIGSGGFWGKGFSQGTQTKYDFVPEQRTDFIFCTIGEEWGFVGSAFVVLLYTFLIIRIILVSENQKSQFSRIYGYGVASILFFHFFINIGMTIGLIPVIGIPLPFISYGGSSLWAFTILLFILIKLDSERKFILG